jgi:HEAT repeat protein
LNKYDIRSLDRDHRSLPFNLTCRFTTSLLVAGLVLGSASFQLKAQDASKPQQSSEDADVPAPVRGAKPESPAVDIDTAWSLLTSAMADTKHPELRISALAGIGTLGSNKRAERLIYDASKDPDLDIRTAAILAAGQSKNRNLTPRLRALLDDKEPQVAFAAATTLWKMGDHSGEDILVAVTDGERKAGAGLISGSLHTADKDLHSPSTLARIGALQGASMLLGPFGFGITAYEYIHKNGGDSARTLAIELLSQEKTKPIHDELLAALADKDLGVRAAAAKALGDYHDPATAAAIANLFYDPKPPIRLTAAAAYLRASGAVVSPSSNLKHAPKKP